MGQSLAETRHKLPRVSSSTVMQDMLNSPTNKLWQHTWNAVYQGNSLETQFLLGGSHVDTLPNTYQNFRLPRGKQVFSINHTGCTNSLGRYTEPVLSVLQIVGTLPHHSSQTAAKGQPCKQAFLRINRLRPAMLTLLHNPISLYFSWYYSEPGPGILRNLRVPKPPCEA